MLMIFDPRYATEIDIDLVKRSVRAIGRCAIKLEDCAEMCVGTLLDLVSTKISYVVQEVIVVAKNILRRYPDRFENIIPALCENIENLIDSDAKAAVIWIVGEYSQRIVNAVPILDMFLDNFRDEEVEVQLQTLTACVKTFLKRSSSAQEIIQKVLQLATESTQCPDLRDRAYVYWRLLSSDPKIAKVTIKGGI